MALNDIRLPDGTYASELGGFQTQAQSEINMNGYNIRYCDAFRFSY